MDERGEIIPHTEINRKLFKLLGKCHHFITTLHFYQFGKI